MKLLQLTIAAGVGFFFGIVYGIMEMNKIPTNAERENKPTGQLHEPPTGESIFHYGFPKPENWEER